MSVTHGQRVIAGRYRLINIIGSGGAGVVWRAQDDLLDRDVAVKEIARLAGADERTRSESYARTLREARAAARISHPGVAAVYDVVSEDDCPYIVMELIGGHPLSGLIADEVPLPLPDVADIGRQVLAALLAGHAAGVLHRDLKPGNVLITPDGRAVLTDFGIASVAGDPSITRTGVVVGTPGYLAPERIKGEPASPAADLWSLGATLYAAACGRGPYDGYDGAIATMYAVVSEDPPLLPFGGPLRGIIDALLNRDPRLRPEAAQVAMALDAAAGPRAFDTSGPSGHSYGEVPWEHVPSEPALSAPVALGPVAEPVEEPPRTITSDLPRVRTPTDGASLLLEPPGDDAGERGAGEFGAGERGAGERGAGHTRWMTGSMPAQPPRLGTGRRSGRRAGRRRRGIVAAGAAVAAGAVAVALTVALSNQKPPPKEGNTANTTLPAVSQQFRVVAASDTDGSTEVIGRAQSGALLRDRFANGSWSGWIPLPGGLNFTGVPTVTTAKDGRLVVFARTGGGNLDALWQQSPGSQFWNGPVQLGSSLVTSDPSAVALTDGHLEVFARLGDGTLGTASQPNAADFRHWSGWTSLGGQLSGPPVAALNVDGRPEVFARSTGGLMHDYWLNGSWAGWARLPAGGITGVPAVGRNADGRLEVFARTSSGAIVNVWQKSAGSGSWQGPGVIPIGNATRDPAVMSVNGGRLEVFVVVANGTMMHTWQIAPNGVRGWNAPGSLAGKSDSAPTVIRVNGISQLFARGPDGKIGYNHLDHPVGAWTGWSGSGQGGTF